MKGIVERMKAAGSKTEVNNLLVEASGYRRMIPKTARKVKRIADAKLASFK